MYFSLFFKNIKNNVERLTVFSEKNQNKNKSGTDELITPKIGRGRSMGFDPREDGRSRIASCYIPHYGKKVPLSPLGLKIKETCRDRRIKAWKTNK